ncbi:MAG TPA: nucleotidyl transferase AbiEii/AbiGii toxin family protein [Pyrinomonadaceae bacterium]|nr:nucleotidyl transferase AbiEii/AbiGii toxin family protein [Pyrinomonadaceae bacterium]
MLNAGVLTFQEFAMREPLPLATVHEAVLEFVRGRDDVVVFGATAVNAYVSEPRMTQDIDLMSTRAAELVQELRDFLSERFHIAVRVRVIGEGKGYRVFQIRKEGNRHLVDVRPIATLPQAEMIDGIRVIAAAELIARKVISLHSRRGQPKSGTDWRDVAMLLLAFPTLKTESGSVSDILNSLGATEEEMKAWSEVVHQEISKPDDDSEFD